MRSIEQRIQRLEEKISEKRLNENSLEDEEDGALDGFCEYATQFF